MGIEAAIIGSAIGAVSGRKSAKDRRASIEQDRTDRMEGYNFSKPYIERSYDRSEGALNDSLDQGTYQGQTYADQNPYFSAGNHYMGGMGAMGGQGAFDVMQQGQGFANNYADLYQQGGADRMQQAQDYAINNSGGLVNEAMRDDRRNLEENTLTGINQGASGSGNMNSSRAGVAEAVANRGYDDRKADVTAGIQQNLMGQSINQQNQQFSDQMRANQGLQQSYGSGINAMNSFGGMMTGAGNNFMNYEQGYMNDQRNRYQNDRDFALNQNMKYQKGVLGNAVYNTTPGDTPEKPNTLMSTLGGAQAGFSQGMNLFGGG
tara:strand:+ start:92 stop:1048 length:957 start_codon:yes stop_codon:yes gene_type:complete